MKRGKRKKAASRSDPRELEVAARAASRLAHSPYSKVRVGAALRAADGRVFTGCNVENASYGLTICAERVALTKAVSEGATEFTELAISASGSKLLMPCGACRQVLHEFAPNLRVVVVGPRGTRRTARLGKLLPLPFGPDDLRPRR